MKKVGVDFYLPRHLEFVPGVCHLHGKFQGVRAIGDDKQVICPTCKVDGEYKEHLNNLLAVRIEHLLRLAQIPTRYALSSSENFIVETQQQENIIAALKSWLFKFKANKNCGGILMSGKNGTGKTHLGCALLISSIKNFHRTARYTNAAGMAIEINAAIQKEGDSIDAQINKFSNYDLLLIDELDKVNAATDKSDTRRLLQVIENRYNQLLPTIGITNLSAENLRKMLGDTIIDRFIHGATLLTFSGDNYRTLEKSVD